MLTKYLVVFFSVQPHASPPYNVLNLAKEIAKENSVILIDPPTVRASGSLTDTLFLVTNLCLFFLKKRGLIFYFQNNRTVFSRKLLRMYLNLYGFLRQKKVLLYTTTPERDDMYDYVPAKIKILDCYDVGRNLDKYDEQFLKSYNFILTNSPAVYKILKKYNKNCYLISAGYNNYKKIYTRKHIPNTVLFYGGIQSRILYDWLYKTIKTLPKVHFYFMGEVYLNKHYVYPIDKKLTPVWEIILKLPNAHYIQPNLDENKSQIARSIFSVGIIPYQFKADNIFSYYSHPMKIYDYIASGIPVVSTPLNSMLQYKSILPISFAKNQKEFTQMIQKYVKSRKSFTPRIAKKALIILKSHNLQTKMNQINKMLMWERISFK